jgi:hypothetical protein
MEMKKVRIDFKMMIMREVREKVGEGGDASEQSLIVMNSSTKG